MKILRVFAWLLLSLLLILVGVSSYLPFYLQNHKAELETAASKALGRPVVIDRVTLGWLLHPRPALSIALQGLRVSNPDWDKDDALGPYLLEADRVDLSLQLRALLWRQVRIDQLLIRDARLMLRKTPDGRNNWQLGGSKDKDTGKIRLRMPRIQVFDSEIAFAPAKGRVRRADITELQLDGLGAPPLVLQAELRINQTPLRLSANVGTSAGTSSGASSDASANTGANSNASDAQAPTGARWPFQVQAQSADTRIELNGSAPAPFEISGLEAKLQVQGPTAIPLGNIAGITGLPDAPFQLNTDLSWSGQTLKASAISGSLDAHALPAPLTLSDGEINISTHQAWSVRLAGKLGDQPAMLQLAPIDPPQGDAPVSGAQAGGPQTTATQSAATKPTSDLMIEATLADSRFNGKLRPASADARARLSGTLKLGAINLGQLTRAQAKQADASPPPKAPATKTQSATAPSWIDRPLPFAALTRFDADLDLAAEALTWKQITLRKLQAQAKLSGGRLQIDGARLALPGLTVTGQAVIDASAKSPALSLQIKTERIDLAEARSMLTQSPKLDGRIVNLSLDAAATGSTPATLIRALSGTLKAESMRLLPPAKRGQETAAIELTSPSVRVDAGQAVRFTTSLARAGQALDLTLTGGPLADLLPAGQSWPRIEIAAQTRIHQHALSIRGHLGPLAAIGAGRDLRVNLTLTEDTGLSGALTGTLARLDGLAGNQLQAQFKAKSLATLHPGLPAQPFAASARVQGQADQIELLDLKAKSAGSDLAGQVRIALRERPQIDATLNAETLDLIPFLAPDAHPDTNPADKPGGAKEDVVSPIQRNNTSERPLPLDALTRLDGSLKLSAAQVQFGHFSIDNGQLYASLDAGHLVLAGDAGQDRLSVNLDVQPGQTSWQFDLHHQGNLNLDDLIKSKHRQTTASDLPAAIDIRLHGTGASMPALLGTADGHLGLVLGAGRLDRKASGLPLGGVVVSLLDTVNPADFSTIDLRRDLLSLKCAVLQFDVADGIATSKRGLALQTDNLNVLGGGAIKLETGEIQLSFKTAKRTGVGLSLLGIADRFIDLTGTLKAPRASINRRDLLVESGAAWATGGLSLVADQILGRLSAFGNPCEKVLKRYSDAP
ncbi:uncharacterized protein involved in outer membrane biogenesis [Thiorhodovibrio frisius]|uniref:Uncharacterized protein involved in outer membrane biogenesis n=2 Tax=Thiorhodovibrio frisius TaxID=631362 RepID=H8Z6Q2_9GAMM|nr:uncharacterized protein involved in outer membrane biogenesis [Thiorhodovibrio frisius]WPL21516.1 putative assembly protein [Thiorhodovibrio frisius]